MQDLKALSPADIRRLTRAMDIITAVLDAGKPVAARRGRPPAAEAVAPKRRRRRKRKPVATTPVNGTEPRPRRRMPLDTAEPAPEFATETNL